MEVETIVGDEFNPSMFEQSNSTAIALMLFNRPHYHKKCIESLEQCNNKEEVDWYILIDGSVNKYSGDKHSNQNNINKSIKLARDANLPNKKIIKNKHNLGAAAQYDKWLSLLDEYNKAVKIEGDVIVSTHYIKHIKSLLNQYPERMVAGYREHNINNLEVPEDLEKVYFDEDFIHLITGLSSSNFSKFRDEWEEFANEIIYQHDWWPSNRPINKVMQFIGDGELGKSVDGVIHHYVAEKDINCVSPVVSRASNIGKYGQNSTRAFYQAKNFGEEGKLEYHIDKYKINWEVKNK